jgi:uncharacterized membrane protein
LREKHGDVGRVPLDPAVGQSLNTVVTPAFIARQQRHFIAVLVAARVRMW